MPPDPRYRHRWPRSVFTLFVLSTGWVSLACAVVAVLILSRVGWQQHRVDDFNKSAIAVTATVERIIGDEALIRYVVPAGTFAQRIKARTLGVGEGVSVWVHPDRPFDVSRTAQRQVHFRGFAQICGGFFGALALVLGWRAGVAAVRAVKARMYGGLLQATVTRVEIGAWNLSARDPLGRLHWKDPDGHFGASFWQSHAHVAQWSSGDTTLIYRRHGQGWWVDDLGDRPVLKTGLPVVK